ncbi:zinc-binding alcohol dehydrogenase family protein [Viridibacillus arvi]|uniref:zinc-binding alcohol dehydrogenase family protein n=1 Tax=Viridibacillus arvi TaxID=263475 RepID=UPI0036E00FFD
MKQIVCIQPHEMALVDVPKPTIQQADDVLIHIKRIGICGTDIHAYGGNQPFFSYPRVLGHELAGEVSEIGRNVEHLQVGDLVTIIPYVNCGQCAPCTAGKTNCCTNIQVIGVHADGGMGEYLTVPSKYVIKTNGLSLDNAAIVEPLSIGAHAVRRTNLTAGESVLVIGAGPIGIGVARFAKLQGATTFLMDLSEERLNFSKDWTDADAVFQPSEQVLDKLREKNNGQLPTIVFDATGNKHSMMKAFEYAEHGGTVVYVGLVKDTISFFDPDFHAKEMTLLGSRNATLEDFQYVIDSMQNGSVKEGYVTKKITFEQTPEYFQQGDFRTNKAQITLEK